MPDDQGKWWSFFKGVGGVITGVLTAVLAALLIKHFTDPAPGPAPVITSASQLGLSGFIRDAVTEKNVPDARVMVGLGPSVVSQSTDADGEFAFVLSGADPSGNQLTLTVLANGYDEWSGNFNLPAGPRFADVKIVPAHPAVVPAGPAAGGVAPGPVANLLPSVHLGTQMPKSFKFRPPATLALKK